MLCPNCSHSFQKVLRTQRERRIRDDKLANADLFGNTYYSMNKFRYTSDIDSRIILCEKCGKRFLTETKIVGVVEYDRVSNSSIIKPLDR